VHTTTSITSFSKINMGWWWLYAPEDSPPLCGDGDIYYDHVTVTDTISAIPVDDVILSETSASLTIGSTLALTATVNPVGATNKTVIWSSSDEEVATVDENGLVTALKEGTAIITVTTEDGNKTATCTVIVTATPITNYTITIGEAYQGGAGYVRDITMGYEEGGSLAGKYLVVQLTKGTGVNASVSVMIYNVTSKTSSISYDNQSTGIKVWLTDGMPNLTAEDIEAEIFAYAATS
jgi:uncharacterized protein YjdB